MYLTEILARCSEMEARLAQLYRKLAATAEPSDARARLWGDLALDDEAHATFFSEEHRRLEEQGETGGSAPDFADRIADAMRCLERLEASAAQVSTKEEATALAIALEQIPLEDLYDDLVLHGPGAFRNVCERLDGALSSNSARHVRESAPREREGRGSLTRRH